MGCLCGIPESREGRAHLIRGSCLLYTRHVAHSGIRGGRKAACRRCRSFYECGASNIQLAGMILTSTDLTNNDLTNDDLTNNDPNRTSIHAYSVPTHDSPR